MSDGHCFISYSNGDADEFGMRLALELESGNPFIDTWYDKRDVPAGSTWDEKVPEAIKTCKCFIFVMTKDSIAEKTICADEWDLALRYKRPILILRLDKEITEAPFRLGKRQWIDFGNNPKAALAKLRLAIQRLDSPEGHLDFLRDRLADANRDLTRTQSQDEIARIKSEMKDLSEEITTTELIKKDPDKAKKQTRKHINAGLERDRQPINPIISGASSKFINPRPGSIPDYFEGRVVETEEIADFLRNDFQRIMTINGRAGSGKTVLACRVLQRLENGQFPNDLGEFKIDGIVYLSEISNYKINVANIFSGVIELIEPQKVSQVSDLYKEAKVPIDEKIRALLAALPAEPVILLLDNFEDLLESDDDAISDQELLIALTTILQADSHNLKILITTRELPRQLNMIEPARQYVKHLDEGLPSPFAEHVLRKMDKDGHAGLRDATDELLGRVREATLGYPRALESLYAILRVDRYSNVEELLIEGLPETVVEKFVGEAFSRLDATKQKIIQALAVYNRPVSSAAVDFALQLHVPGVNSSTILERLVSMHFVRREAKRYFLHPADREYALSRMPKGDVAKKIGQGARARTWNQHSLTLRGADYFVEIRKPRIEWIKLDDLNAQLAEFDLRCAAGDYDTAANVLIDIDFDYLLLWGHYRLIIDLHEEISAKIKDLITHMTSLSRLGIAYRSVGDVKKALNSLDHGLSIAREAKDLRNEGAFLGNLGINYSDLGETSKAISYYEQALAISRKVGDRQSEGIELGNLGQVTYEIGQTKQAIDYCELALTISHELEDAVSKSRHLGNLGDYYIDYKNLEKSIDCYRQSIQIADEISNIQVQSGTRSRLSLAYLIQGDLINAQITIKGALQYNVPENNHNATVLHGIIALRQGARKTAQEAFAKSIGQADEILAKTPEYYDALDAKGLSICGLTICDLRLKKGDSQFSIDDLRSEASETFIKARKIAPHAGVVKSVLRLFDELVKCDEEGILKGVREVIEMK